MSKKKASTPTDEKFENQDFDLFQALDALDKKDYSWFDRLSEEQQRKFVPYMMLHWMSAIKANGQVGNYYLMSTDSSANLHMFNEYVQKHPQLQWLMLCAISPGIGKQFHQWLPHLSEKISSYKESANLKSVKEYFEKIYKTADKAVLDEFAKEYTTQQQHKHRLAKLHPEMKLADLEVLGALVSKEDIDNYDRDSGN